MVSREQIDEIISDIINDDSTEKCRKPHISDLPYNAYASTSGKLNRRAEAILNGIKEREDEILENEKEAEKFKKQMDSQKKNMEEYKSNCNDYMDSVLSRGEELFEKMLGDESDDDGKVYWEDNGRGKDYNTFASKFNTFGKNSSSLQDTLDDYFNDRPYGTQKAVEKLKNKTQKSLSDLIDSAESIQGKDNGDKLIFKSDLSELNNIKVDLGHVGMYFQNYANEKTGYEDSEYWYRHFTSRNVILNREIDDLKAEQKKNDARIDKLEEE